MAPAALSEASVACCTTERSNRAGSLRDATLVRARAELAMLRRAPAMRLPACIARAAPPRACALSHVRQRDVTLDTTAKGVVHVRRTAGKQDCLRAATFPPAGVKPISFFLLRLRRSIRAAWHERCACSRAWGASAVRRAHVPAGAPPAAAMANATYNWKIPRWSQVLTQRCSDVFTIAGRKWCVRAAALSAGGGTTSGV
jgi:hypothetical protein